MSDLISREQTIAHLKKRLIETAINNTGVRALCDSIFADTADNRIEPWINEIPSAEKTFTWEPITKLRDAVQCSNCKKFKAWSFAIYDIRYCPICGARLVDDEH